MKKHTIAISDFKGCKFSQRLASCVGRSENKDVRAVVDGLNVHYEVWSEGKLVIATIDFEAAISEYNDA